MKDEYTRNVIVEELFGKQAHHNRTYIDDPSEAPDFVNVQEGERGGYYYELPDGVTEDEAQELSEDIGEIIDHYSEQDEVADHALEEEVYEAFERIGADPDADNVWEFIQEVIEPQLEEQGVDVRQSG